MIVGLAIDRCDALLTAKINENPETRDIVVRRSPKTLSPRFNPFMLFVGQFKLEKFRKTVHNYYSIMIQQNA